MTSAVAWGAAVGAAGVAVSATGSLVVAAVLLAVATRNIWSGGAVLLAVAAVGVHQSTVDFSALAGEQSVVGPAGWTGSGLAVASTWASGLAVVLAGAAAHATTDRRLQVAVALGSGALAAAIVAGPGPGGAIWVRVLAVSAATIATLAVARVVHRAGRVLTAGALAVLAGAAAVVLAVLSDPPGDLDRLGLRSALESAGHLDALLVALAFALPAVVVLPVVAELAPGRLALRRVRAIEHVPAPPTPTNRADGHSIHEVEREVRVEEGDTDEGSHVLDDVPPHRRHAPIRAPEPRVAPPARAVRHDAAAGRPARGGRLRGRPGRAP